MLSNRSLLHSVSPENPLWVSWHDAQMIPSLNPSTVMDYFCRKLNPFYDKMCNNETIRMQRLGLEQLNNMIGLEYILLHVAEPILYVIRKQHRHSPAEATPIADYYIINGMVYKAPDLGNVISSRVLSTVSNLQLAFEEASSYSKYHPNKGYTWDFSSNKALSEKAKTIGKKVSKTKDDVGTVFQMQRVDMLLAELLRKFPPPIPPILHQQQIFQQQSQAQPIANAEAVVTESIASATNKPTETSTATTVTLQPGLEPKNENVDMKPPPEKKPKL